MCKCAHLGEISFGQKAPQDHLRSEVFVHQSPSSKAKASKPFRHSWINL